MANSSKSDNINIILQQLKILEPDATFNLNLPTVVSSGGKSYFVKLGSASHTEQYTGEVESLIAINVAAPGLAPKVLAHSIIQDIHSSIFISEYKKLSPLSSSASQKLATRLALELHSRKSTNGFGFLVPTYCGPTRLKNGWFNTWEECYSSTIADLLDGLKKKRGDEALYEKGQKIRNMCAIIYCVSSVVFLCNRVIPFLLRPLSVDPVLLHGDLWVRNNFLILPSVV